MQTSQQIQAYLATLDTSTAGARAGEKLVFTALVEAGNQPLTSVFDGLAEGYKNRDEFVRQTLCSTLAFLCRYLSETGALILIVLGVYQAFQILRSIGGAAVSVITGIFEFLTSPIDSLSTWAKKLFGASKSDSQAAVNMLETAFTASLPAPFAALKTLIPSSASTAANASTGTSAAGSNTANPTSTNTSTTLAQAIANAVVAAIGGLSDSQKGAILRDAHNGVRRGQPIEQIKQSLISRYSK